MQALTVPVQLISSSAPDPNNPIENPVQFLQQGDVQISTGGGAFVEITTLPTASGENNTDLIIQLSDAEAADDYNIRFHDPDGVWVDFEVSVTLPDVAVDPPVEPITQNCPNQFSVCLQENGGNPIKGALIFASTDQAGDDIVDVTISDKDGKAEFTGLEIGTYYATTKINGQTIDVRPFEVKN